MRRVLLAIICFIGIGFGEAKAQWVTIPDSAFAAFLRQQYPACMNGSLMDTTCGEVLSTTVLNCGGNEIADLTGVEYFENLDSLVCYGILLENITALPRNLSFLDCGLNNLFELPPIPNTLRHLNCNGNYILNGLPVLPDGLRYLDCSWNPLEFLPEHLPDSLEQLRCENNLLDTLPALPPLLRILDCRNNNLKLLPPIPNSLRGLVCSSNRITDLPGLPNELYSLFCDSNLLSVINLPDSLKYFNCSKNRLTSLPQLPEVLVNFYCSHNSITTLPNIPSRVMQFHCDHNLLSQLPELPSGLRQLVCGYNNFSSLPDMPNDLAVFKIDHNPLIACMPFMKRFSGIAYWFSIEGTKINCLSNAIIHQASIPAIDTLPICDLFNNPNGCAILWNIQGRIYQDDNADCIYQSAEVSLSRMKVNLYESGNLIQSGYFSNGYSFDTHLSTFKVSMDTNNLPMAFTCPVSGEKIVQVTAQDSLKGGIDFGLRCKPGFDIGAKSISGDRFRPAWNTQVNIQAGDMANAYGVYCATGISGSVNISFTGPATYISPAPGALTPSNVSGNTITYIVPDFGNINFDKDFNIIIRTDTFAQAGQQICITVSVTPTAGDNNPANNVLTQCFEVRTSYDPNDKQVSPITGTGNGWLTYTIRFQNTGNDTAIHVYVEDTLDVNLDMASFQLLAYSHPNVTQVLPGGVVKFNFPNIYLPDSNVNEPLSHGYVQYKVKLKDNVALGTEIRNTAYIYFDFNAPVVTNTTSNLFCIPDTVDVDDSFCSGGFYSFHGTTLTAAGEYTALLQKGNGCDSVILLHLIEASPTFGNISTLLCNGDTFYVGTKAYTEPGVYQDTIQNVFGCDSIIRLELDAEPAVAPALQVHYICDGDTLWVGPIAHTTENIYRDTLQSVYGCDSVLLTDLRIYPVYYAEQNAVICEGESYLFGGVARTETGEYINALSTINGCDSIIYLYLRVDSLHVSIQQTTGDTLKASGTGTIRWWDCTNSVLIPNQTDSIYATTLYGNYAAIFSSGDCVDTTECMLVGFTGLENTAPLLLEVYPNPSSADGSRLTVDSRLVGGMLKVFDANGQLLFSSKLTAPSSQLNMALPSGVYLIEVEKETVNARKRWVKVN